LQKVEDFGVTREDRKSLSCCATVGLRRKVVRVYYFTHRESKIATNKKIKFKKLNERLVDIKTHFLIYLLVMDGYNITANIGMRTVSDTLLLNLICV
jgi:hypothetical protein